jgi:MFS family permease
MLIFLPNVFCLSLITAVGYGYMYILYTTISTTFMLDYDWNRKTIGLVYLGSAAGNVLAMVIGGPASDYIVRTRAARGNTRPENRLLLMTVMWPLVTVGLILYGWSADFVLEWYYPMLGTAIFGMGSMSAIVSSSLNSFRFKY